MAGPADLGARWAQNGVVRSNLGVSLRLNGVLRPSHYETSDLPSTLEIVPMFHGDIASLNPSPQDLGGAGRELGGRGGGRERDRWQWGEK